MIQDGDGSRRSRIWIGAPCTFKVPGTVVRVVKSIAETSECVPVNFDINVDWKCKQYPALRIKRFPDLLLTFPTDGKPTNPTEATPVRATSKPTPVPPPPPPDGVE